MTDLPARDDHDRSRPGGQPSPLDRGGRVTLRLLQGGRAGPSPGADRAGSPDGREATHPRPERPDAERLAALVARVYLEVLSGARPRKQLEGLLAPALRRRVGAELHRRFRSRRRGGVASAVRARVRHVVACWPHDDACEATALVDHAGTRTTAVSVRLERHRRAWRVVELATPEDPAPPSRTASLPSR